MSILNLIAEGIFISDNKYIAIFSYENKHNYCIEIPYGKNNYIETDILYTEYNIPTTFYPGKHRHALIIPFHEEISWKVFYNNEVISANINKTSRQCKTGLQSKKIKGNFNYKPFSFNYISGVPIHKQKFKII